MPFSFATVSHKYLNADNTPCSGKVAFTLMSPITNSGVTIVPTEVVAMLDATGTLTQALASTTDVDTFPPNVVWRVDERVQGAPERSFEIAVPSGGVMIDVGGLMPGATPPAFA